MQDHSNTATRKRPSPKMVKVKGHKSIYQRGDQFVVIHYEGHKQVKTFHTGIREAIKAQGAGRSGVQIGYSKEKFIPYADKWIKSYAGRTSRGFDEATRKSYGDALRVHAYPYFRSRRLHQITPRMCQEFATQLQDDLAPRSVLKVLAPLRAMFNDAVKWRDLPLNPAAAEYVTVNRKVNAPDKKRKALTTDEYLTLRSHIDPDWHLLFDFLLETGLRISEALGTQWQDIQGSDLHVTRQFNGGKLTDLKTDAATRTLPLSDGLLHRLREHKLASRYSSDTSPVFASKRGTHLNAHNVRHRVLLPAAKAAGLRWVTFHTLRHTCGTLLFENGRSIKQVAGWLGHTNASFTIDTYISLGDEGVGGANRTLDALDHNLSVAL